MSHCDAIYFSVNRLTSTFSGLGSLIFGESVDTEKFSSWLIQTVNWEKRRISYWLFGITNPIGLYWTNESLHSFERVDHCIHWIVFKPEKCLISAVEGKCSCTSFLFPLNLNESQQLKVCSFSEQGKQDSIDVLEHSN